MNRSDRIINILGASMLVIIVGSMTLSAIGKNAPDWAGDVLKVSVGTLGGAVVGGGIAYTALKPRDPQDPTPKTSEDDEENKP